MGTKNLIEQAQEKQYTDFDSGTKEMLTQKVAQKLQEGLYFDKLNQAQGNTEGLDEGRLSAKLKAAKPNVDENSVHKAVKRYNDFCAKAFYNEIKGMQKDWKAEGGENLSTEFTQSGIYGDDNEISWGFEITPFEWTNGDFKCYDTLCFSDSGQKCDSDFWKIYDMFRLNNDGVVIIGGKNGTYKNAKDYVKHVDLAIKNLGKAFPVLLDVVEAEAIEALTNS